MSPHLSSSDRDDAEPGGREELWCTTAEAAALLSISPSRLRQVIELYHVLPPQVGPNGRIWLRRSDVTRAVQLVGPPHQRGRWAAVQTATPLQDHLFTTRRHTGRPSPHARYIAELPWVDIVGEYEAGATAAAIAARYRIGLRTARRHLQAAGAQLRRFRIDQALTDHIDDVDDQAALTDLG